MGDAREEKLNGYIDGLVSEMDPRITRALVQIPDRKRKLLALRGYLRNRKDLETNWTWERNDSEMVAFYNSKEYKEALRLADEVKVRFESIVKADPTFHGATGKYSLTFKRTHRLMEEQLRNWNTNDKIGMLSQQLWRMSLDQIDQIEHREAFKDFLKSSRLSKNPTLATPGLSDHGRFHAIDFKVTCNGQPIADTKADPQYILEKWVKPGWKTRLKKAVDMVSPTKFDGPLPSPDEPWHYRYRPEL
jgi:hypothetical protein